MASLDNNDYAWIRDWVRSQPVIWADLKTWGLSKATYHSAIQAVEDYMVGGFGVRPATSLKAAIEAVTGPTTNNRAKWILVIWANWRLRYFLSTGA